MDLARCLGLEKVPPRVEPLSCVVWGALELAANSRLQAMRMECGLGGLNAGDSGVCSVCSTNK
jgi:hypothetical protein